MANERSRSCAGPSNGFRPTPSTTPLPSKEPRTTLAIEFESVDIDVTVEESIRQFRVASVKWAPQGKPFREARSLRVRPRQPIRAKVLLRDARGGGSRRVRMRFRAPRRPGSGTIAIAGGGGFFDDDFFFIEDDLDFFLCAAARRCESRTPKANGFDQLLGRLRQRPRNDELVGQMRFAKSRKRVVRRTDRVVGGYKSVRVDVGGRRRRSVARAQAVSN